MKRLLLSLSVISASCSPRLASVNYEMPPLLDVDRSKPLVVEEFTGKKGRRLSSLLERSLFSKNYRVVNRKALSALVAEKALGAKGRIIPAKILVSGHVDRYDFNFDAKPRTAQCISSGGSYEATIYSVTSQAQISSNLTISDLESGEIIHTRRVNGYDSETFTTSCSDNGAYDRPDESSLFAKAEERFLRDFMKTIEPFSERVSIAMLADDSIPEIKEGDRFLRESKLKLASKSYESALNRLRRDNAEPKLIASTLCMCGIARGYLGDPSGARLIDEAYELVANDDFIKEKSKLEDFLRTKSEAKFVGEDHNV